MHYRFIKYHIFFTASMHVRAIAILLLLALMWGCSSKKVADIAVKDDDTEDSKPSQYLPNDDGIPLSPKEMSALMSVGDFDRNMKGEDMQDVMLHFKYYLHKGRRTVEKNVERGQKYLPFIKEKLRTQRMPQDLAYLPFIESGYNVLARSPTGALGMWQFVRGTGTAYGMKRDWWSDERHDPYESTDAALTYLGRLYSMFDDWHLAISSYNAGEGRISRAMKGTKAKNFFDLRKKNSDRLGKDQLSNETLQYLPRFLAVCKIMRNLNVLGFNLPDSSKALRMTAISAKPSSDLMAFARNTGMSWDEFSNYNPHFLRYISPPDRTTKVYVPQALAASANSVLQKSVSTSAGWRTYRVERGDNFSKISAKTGVPVQELRRVNRVSEPLRAGTNLRIPGAEKQSYAGNSKPKSQAKPQTVSSGKTSQKTKTVSSSVAKTKTGSKASPAKKTFSHRVQIKETVWSIARKYNVSPTDLLKINNLTTSSKLKPGDMLEVSVQ